ncbi:MAG: hypothetical protein ABJ003_03685 [Cobetia amphilecti]
MPNEVSITTLTRAVHNLNSVEDLTQTGALGLRAVLIAAFGLTKMPPKITTHALSPQIEE